MVTLAELESATSGAQNRRATKLRYNVINGARERTRISNLTITNRLFYQLNYASLKQGDTESPHTRAPVLPGNSFWLRRKELNLRPLAYEANEITTSLLRGKWHTDKDLNLD